MPKINFAKLPKVVGIVGSREYTQEKWVRAAVRKIKDRIIVSGGARGVDTWARLEALEQGAHYKAFHIEDFEWELLGRTVGHVRNYLLVQWVHWWNGIILLFAMENAQGLTKGSQNVKETCERLGCPYIIINQDGELTWSKSADFAIEK